MEIAMLVLTAIGVAAAIIASLPPLGVDVRVFGRPNMPLEGIPYFRARQAWIAIAVALISLGVSVGAFYYFFRPRVVEKIVEKPVDRIIEKVVPAECPTIPTSAKPSRKGKQDSKANGSLQHPETVINAPQGIGISGGTVSNPTVNNFGLPDRHLRPEQKNAIVATLRGKVCKPTFGALINVEDAMKYAAEIRNAFRAGGCIVPDYMPTVSNSEGGWYGVKVIYHDETKHAEGEAVYTNPNSPEGIVFSALDHAHIDALAGDGTLLPPGEVLVVVGRQRK